MEPETFDYTESDFMYQTPARVDEKHPQLSQFDLELHKRWDKAMAGGVFRYGIDHIITRIIPGPKRYLAQLNTLRATEKRKPQEILHLNHPFDEKIFNFTRVRREEVIFNMRKMTPVIERTCDLGGIDTDHTDLCHGQQSETPERHTLIVNVSPVEYGHCLLVPQIDSCKPQVITETSVRVALETMLLSHHRGMRMGFNSLCGLASVNHLHFHLYYLDHELLVEHSPVCHLAGKYFEFTGHPCPGFVLQLHGSTVDEMARLTHKVTSYLHDSDVAHNIFITRGKVFGQETLTTIRLFLWPRKKYFLCESHSQPLEEFNVACIELAGHLAVKEEAGFQQLTEARADFVIGNSCLSQQEYRDIRDAVLRLGLEQRNKTSDCNERPCCH